MKLISIEGAGDDTVVVVIDGEPAEYPAYDGARFHLISRRGRTHVAVTVDDDSGCWTITVGQISEVHPIPGWPVRIEQSADHEYSARLTVDAPDDTEVVCLA
ncbi:hypothetical protein [Nocardia transvalensis]|uniref:hypothetical protein n=1 Tax=Nocardia transvalensis TaxID=37333 RepID=UPI001892D92E|nr:hypothetical protein [Nocardia transvalensis]MBF6332457.1 hypothetical protein [Nocardia transvalensis]